MIAAAKGRPVERIPLLIPDMPRTEELIGLLREIDERRWYTNFGPLAKRFETQLAGGFEQHALVSVVSVCNCTLALELLLAAEREVRKADASSACGGSNSRDSETAGTPEIPKHDRIAGYA